MNASTAGLEVGDPSPIPEATVATASVVADIVTPDGTELKRLARAHGKSLLAGTAMVAGQIPLMHRFFTSDIGDEEALLPRAMKG